MFTNILDYIVTITPNLISCCNDVQTDFVFNVIFYKSYQWNVLPCGMQEGVVPGKQNPGNILQSHAIEVGWSLNKWW